MRPGLGLIIVCLLATAASARDVEALLRKVPPTHPRLFLSPGSDEALRAKPALGAARKHVIDVATAMLELPPIERKMIGWRMLGTSRTAIRRVTYTAMAHRLTADARFAKKAQQEMLAAAGFADWNPKHFLDVAEMTTALAIGYDWLYDTLDEASRKAIREAIVTKGLKTSLKGGWWVTGVNNWNQVCHGGLSLGALAVAEHEPVLAAKILDRAVENLPRAMAQYAPDGAYPEGPSYWEYGTTYNVLFLAAAASALGTDFGLSESEGFLACSDYYLHATGPTGMYFNYSDGGTGAGPAPAMSWFAAKRRKPSLLWNERRMLARFLGREPTAKGSSNRFFPLLLAWAGGAGGVPEPEKCHWTGGGPNPVSMHRTGWGVDATYVGVKAGSPSVNHGHMDVGGFVMEADGVRWAIDLGAQNYHSLESKKVRIWDMGQESQRWTVFRLNQMSHNILVVDGQPQVVTGKAAIVSFSGEGDRPHTIVDTTPVYSGQLESAKRGVALVGRSVVVRDEIRALDRETKVRWGMVTRAEVSIDGSRATLRQDGKTLILEVLSPAGAKLELFETAKPPMDHDAPNPGTRMIGFTTKLAAKEAASLVVVLRPAGVKAVEAKPFADW
ncbi:MAG: heparinase II/III family protein [Planctomycetota bacterium]